MRPHVHDVVAKLKEGGASKFGCIGFCWGVSIAMQAGQVGVRVPGKVICTNRT